MNQQIRVAVIANAGVGKSMIAQIISEALAAKGLDVEFIEDEHGPRAPATVDHAIQVMQERGIKISVQSVNARRDGSINVQFPALG